MLAAGRGTLAGEVGMEHADPDPAGEVERLRAELAQARQERDAYQSQTIATAEAAHVNSLLMSRQAGGLAEENARLHSDLDDARTRANQADEQRDRWAQRYKDAARALDAANDRARAAEAALSELRELASKAHDAFPLYVPGFDEEGNCCRVSVDESVNNLLRALADALNAPR
ncbi:MAG: hypothetical protein EOO74_02480 [Myxococcales bacterium]|nr:MAG: hypothetical protein EOO74_02480 [Myxococcales bacterium]